ncbi:MAG TPA: DUF1467 family protein [Candidatus Cybelea sp.]|nr:DUF1467 family protein [Candidatus Cybelea sp.]
MAWYTNVAIYAIIWWMVLFMVLPFGVKTAHEADQPLEPGHASSAPVRPLILWKFAITTGIAALIFAAFWAVRHYDLFGADEMFR